MVRERPAVFNSGLSFSLPPGRAVVFVRPVSIPLATPDKVLTSASRRIMLGGERKNVIL